MRRSRADRPQLITTAPESRDDELDRRRRRYLIMMTSRALCIICAALTYRLSLWLALGSVVAGAVLPWCAVIIANDRPPKKRRRVTYGLTNQERQLPGASDKTVDG
jgi:hypothetical protein